MKVGILGSGGVAKALAAGFVKHGHDVVMGTRDSAKLADWLPRQGGPPARRVAPAPQIRGRAARREARAPCPAGGAPPARVVPPTPQNSAKSLSWRSRAPSPPKRCAP